MKESRRAASGEAGEAARPVLSLLAVILVLALLSCGGHRRPRHGVSERVSRRDRVQVGMSSWYGKKFHGRPTASGERYDMYGLSAAHRTLPLGTRARVTNLANGRSVELTINDRGPFVRGRILDCSYGAAKRLHFVNAGLAEVRIEVLAPGKIRKRGPSAGERIVRSSSPAVPGLPPVLDGSFTVQAGAFLEETNALAFRDKLAKAYGDAYVIRFREFYRVRVGHLADEEEANDLLAELRESGIEGFVTRND